MSEIQGHKIRLRPAVKKDRKMIFEWGNESDIAPLLHLSGEYDTFREFCKEWKYYFTDDYPDRGRLFVITTEDSPVGAIAYNQIYPLKKVELDIWMSSEANCGKGYGPDAVLAMSYYLRNEFAVTTFMMQPSARNPRAIRAYEKAGFAVVSATPEQIKAEWGGVDHHDSVLMIKTVT